MKKALAILCLLAVLGGCLAACGKPKPEDLLAGQWKASAGSFEFNAVEFVPSQDDPRKGAVNLGMLSNLLKGSYEVIPGAKKDDQPTLKIVYTPLMISVTRVYLFTVDETTLELQREGSNTALTFTRDTAGAGTTA